MPAPPADNVRITANQSTAPDGSTSASVVECMMAGPAGIARMERVDAGQPYTFSVYLRRGHRVSRAAIGLKSGRDEVTANVELREQWVRADVTLQAAGESQATMTIWLHETGGAASPSDSMHVWGPQLESGPFPTSYIPTGAAPATRAPERIRLSPEAVGSAFFNGRWKVTVWPAFASSETGPSQKFVVFAVHNERNRLQFHRREEGVVVELYGRKGPPVRSGPIVFPRAQAITLVVDLPMAMLTISGVQGGGGSFGGGDPIVWPEEEVSVGALHSGKHSFYGVLSQVEQA